MNAKKIIIVISALLINVTYSYSSITTALMSGDWTEAIWDNGVPGCYDTIVIPIGIQVDISTTVDLEACADSIVLIVEGRLEFQNGKKLKLPCGSDVMVPPGGSVGVGSGGGSSTYIEICSTQYWNASSGDILGPDQLCDGGCPPLIPLPINLLYFDADYKEHSGQVHLNWRTASELDNDYFTVEKSKNGSDWVFVCQQDGAVNSSQEISYTDVDIRPFPGVSYYRLKQTDLNGESTYSPIVSVNKDEEEFLVYPNPVKQGGELVIAFYDNLSSVDQIAIFSSTGKLIKSINTEDMKDSQSVIISTENLSKGIYFISLNNKVKRIMVD